jgi:hypothetical protein
MPGPGSIPDDVKWRISTEFAARLPALYDKVFRPTVGDRYDEMEQEIWMEVAKIAFSTAKNLSLPLATPPDMAETLRTVMIILFGPGFKSETLEVADDRAVILVKRCPLLDMGMDNGTDGNRTFRKCMALTLTSIPQLNGNFSARFVRTMCTGDRQCEIKIARTDMAAAPLKGKK